MDKTKKTLSKASSLFRAKVKAAKWYIRLIVTGIVGYGLFCGAVVCADFLHNQLANHTLAAVGLSVLAVNIFVSFPTLVRGYGSIKSWGQTIFNETDTKKASPVENSVMTPAAASSSTPTHEQTLADVADEFAASVAEVSEVDLEEENFLETQRLLEEEDYLYNVPRAEEEE